MSYNHPKHKISIPNNISMEEIQQEIKNGAEFIVFIYSISFLVITLKRYSTAHFIRAADSYDTVKKHYNKISRRFGWWAIPYGISHTLACIKFNNEGGLNVTEDIMLNITEDSIKSNEVELVRINTIFNHPDSEDTNLLKKVIQEKLATSSVVNELIVGYFLNLEMDELPYYVVGISTSGDFKQIEAEVRKAIYSVFFRQTIFEFVDLNSEEEYIEKLKRQGLKLI